MLEGQISARFGFLGTLLQALPWLHMLLPLLKWPGTEDSERLRAWYHEIVAFLDKLADLTATNMDDEAVAALKKILSNNEAWAMMYSLLVAMQTDENTDGDEELLLAPYKEHVGNLADKVGIPVPTIVALIMMMLQAIKFFRAKK